MDPLTGAAAGAAWKHKGKIIVAALLAVALVVGGLSQLRSFVMGSGGVTGVEAAYRGVAAASGQKGTTAVAQCTTNGYPVTSNPGEMPKGPATQYDALFARAAASTPGALDSTTMKAQAKAESGWNPNAKSPVGAAGLIQFMPGTWAAHGIDGDGDGRADVLNPVDNAMSSAKYIASIRKQVSHLSGDPTDLVLAAYNAGPGNVLKYGGVPPFKETRNYIARIRAMVTEWGASVSTAVAACQSTTPTNLPAGAFVHPVQGKAPRTSGFGQRWGRLHAGVDFGIPVGTPLVAVTAGKVTHRTNPGGYGTYIELTAADGTSYRYGHMSRYATADGATVQAGQLIGYSGNTGRSTGPHLHFETRPGGKPVDPVPYMKARGVAL